MASEEESAYRHEALFFAGAESLVSSVLPVVEGALAGGETVALICAEAHNAALEVAIGAHSQLECVDRAWVFRGAVPAVRFLRDFVQERIRSGVTRVRVVSEAAFSGHDDVWGEWRKYETLHNQALSRLPLWNVCAYDIAVLADPVIATAELTHPFVRQNGRVAANPAYVDPSELNRLAENALEAMPDLEPAANLLDVFDLHHLHHQLGELLRGAGMPQQLIEDTTLAVHEVATNGLVHGQPPVAVRLWLSPGRAVATVSDSGPGWNEHGDLAVRRLDGAGPPIDERAAKMAESGYGIWLARQLCDEVTGTRTPEGFTVRLVKHF
ncbi:MAG TPA: sensor histidine kinase [Nocardioidaceae bacterium]|jgi:anti-sigma regulatory factor (Ser/Thr protein kinase)|nr:sensor histidine kinase [Nocardioidaceae bacterium]